MSNNPEAKPRRRALIVEDSRTQAIIITKMFQKAGYDVECVDDAASALVHLEANRFDLIVLDVFLKESNTLDHVQSFRTVAHGAPIAIMTAGRSDDPEAAAGALNKARRARVDFLLPKPFYFDDVTQICEDVEAFWMRVAAA